MNKLFGIETEYGITVTGRDGIDVVAESIEIVRSYTDHGSSMKWDYELEDPHRDARGFRAAELLQDTDEANYFEIDSQRPLSFREIKSDLVLSNGARFYNDHAHPEYSTPECSTLRELVAQDKAGELILAECARRRNARLPEGEEVRLYKNNTDFAGHSYGCHDNYLIPRSVAWDALVEGVTPFLITRQIFAGAGKMGLEEENGTGRPGVFQISQRADFFSVLVSIDTMNQRPLVNTRDEPHANRQRFRRFHCIIGDANMNEVATALKVGTTALVLELIERGRAPAVELADPVAALKHISRDPSWEWIVELKDGRKISAIDLQRLYLEAASRHCDASHEETRWVLGEWEAVLNDLALDPMRCMDRVDWVAKRFLLESFREEEGLEWSDPWLQSIDLEYHLADPSHGLYYEMLQSCSLRRVVSDEEIRAAMTEPPTGTRAFFRGRAVSRFARSIDSIQWDEVVFLHDGRRLKVSLADAFDADALERLARGITTAADPAELVRRI